MYSLLFLSSSADAGSARPRPQIVCDEPEFFFVPTQNTETIARSFTLVNEGDAPLLIHGIRSDCGCVLTKLAKDALAPGEETVLTAEFNLKGRSGKQLRRIIIESNDPNEPRFILTITGEAIAPLEIIPDKIYWGNLHVSSAAEKSCEIRFHERDETYINSATVADKSFAAELITTRPRRVYKVVVRPVPPLRPGRFETNLRLETDHPRFKTVEIPMQGRVVADIYAIPDEINVEAKDGRPAARAVLIYSGLKTKFNVIKVEPPSPDIQVNIRKMSLGGGYRIDLRNIKPAPELDGKAVVITTDCEKMPVISVPLKVIANSP